MAQVDSGLVVAQELDYKKIEASHPSYELSRVLPMSGSQSVTISATSQIETMMELPAKVMNLSKSSLSFLLTPPVGIAGVVNWAAADTMAAISTIELFTRSGVYLAQLNNVQNYVKIVRKAETPFQDFECMDATGRLYKNGSLGYTFTEVPATTIVSNAKRADNTDSMPIIESRYLEVGTAAAATPLVYFHFPLSAFRNTIFSIDKDLFFGEILVLRILWGPGTKLGHTTTGSDVKNPTTGAAAVAADWKVSLLTLHTAIERNPDVIKALVDKVNGPGFSMLCPYVFSYKHNLSSTSQNVSLKFNRGHGHTLRRIYHTTFHNTESSNTAYNCSNIAAAKVVSYYTMMDNTRLQQSDLATAAATLTDWLYNREHLRGSVILNSDVYQWNWMHIDDFGYAKAPADEKAPVSMENLVAGLPLSSERKWDFIATTADNAHNHYTWAVCQRTLKIEKGVISLG